MYVIIFRLSSMCLISMLRRVTKHPSFIVRNCYLFALSIDIAKVKHDVSTHLSRFVDNALFS